LAMARINISNNFNCKVLAIKQPASPLTTKSRPTLSHSSTSMDFSQIEISTLSVPEVLPPKIPYQAFNFSVDFDGGGDNYDTYGWWRASFLFHYKKVFCKICKPLALPWGQTPRLDSDARVRKHVVREWDPCRAKARGYRDCGRRLPSADVTWSVGDMRERPVTDPRPSCCIRAVASVTLGLVPARYVVAYMVGPMPYCNSTAQASTLHLLLTMSSIYDVKSTLSQTALDAFGQKYHIPDAVHPELPTPNQSIHNSLV
nr:adenine nucleotide alpha hydrolases-like superfamily protein [Tanacetum cinerariifolium]